MKTGFNYCVSYGGGVGPDVWDREIEVSAVDIADAISQVSGRVKEECGWIFMVSQEDYPQTTREKFDEKLNQIRAQRDEHYGEANQLRIKVSERDRKIAELEKRDVESIKHINRVATWAQQDPTGPLHVHGIQAWVLNELKQALGAHGEAQPWTPTISLIKDIDNATRELAEAKADAKKWHDMWEARVNELAEAKSEIARLREDKTDKVEDEGNPEELGKLVREVWIEWAQKQPNCKDSWLVRWDGLSEPDKEVDRLIGSRLFAKGFNFKLAKGDDTPCTASLPLSSVSNAAHDTFKPSV